MRAKDLEAALVAWVESSDFAPHAPFPSRKEIEERFSAHSGMVNTVMKRLEMKGLFYAIPGTGCFVSPYRRRGEVIFVFSDRYASLVRFSDFSQFVHAAVRAEIPHTLVSVISLDEREFTARVQNLHHLHPNLLGVVVFRYPEILLAHLPVLRKKKVPVFFYGSDCHEAALKSVPSFFYRETEIANLAVDHLVAKGHRRIAMVSRVSANAAAMARKDAWRAALKARGLACDDDLDMAFHETAKMGKTLPTRFEAAGRPSALFCFDETLAVPALQALLGAGLRVPDDVAIVSVNNPSLTEIVTPSLTVVDIPLEEDATRILRALASGDRPTSPLTSALRLVTRRST